MFQSYFSNVRSACRRDDSLESNQLPLSQNVKVLSEPTETAEFIIKEGRIMEEVWPLMNEDAVTTWRPDYTRLVIFKNAVAAVV